MPQSAGANEQPNLVVVMTDDQTLEELSECRKRAGCSLHEA